MSGLRTLSATTLLITSSFFISGALLEIGVRVLLGTQVKFPRRVVAAPWGLRINEPGATYWHHSPDVLVHFRINAQGMRADNDYPYEKTPGVQRIVSLGDSFTVGYEVAVEDTFSSVLERTLNDRGYPVEVLNAGVSGFSTAEEYLYLERELWRYQPDLVLVSFFVNDLEDNLRTSLFTLRDGVLTPMRDTYIPAGRLGDFLNTNFLFSALSERSDAFSLIKEKATYVLKRRMVERNVARMQDAQDSEESLDSQFPNEISYQEQLGVELLNALAASCRSRGVPLLVQSIPFELPDTRTLMDALPSSFETSQEGVNVLHARDVLAPYAGHEQLYWKRSHYHWTPTSHRVAGEALADMIDRRNLLSGVVPEVPSLIKSQTREPSTTSTDD